MRISIHAPHAGSDVRKLRRPQWRPVHFNPRSSCEERPALSSWWRLIAQFQSTLLMRGATATDMRRYTANDNFNPRSSCEERQDAVRMVFDAYKFQSTLLMRGATLRWAINTSKAVFQSTLLMRGATLKSIFPPNIQSEFQSTLLMRGATLRRCPNRTQSHHFNPRSSCEERPAVFLDLFLDVVNFNPRSSCEERRHFPERLAARRYFNPRSSCEERPMLCTASRRCANFNPRSSCEERRRWRALISTRWYFNPRSSCEERRGLGSASCTATEFQSTLLMRGATIAKTQFKFDGTFQSTLLMRGATIGTRLLAMMSDEFQSTLLMRGATSLVA